MNTLRYGSRGDDVKTLQGLLGNLTADGVFGSQTRSAVKAYQTARALEADGIVGRLTWAALLGTSVRIGAKPVDYKQTDSRWKNARYSTHTDKQTIGNSGCGVTAMADIVATCFGDDVTPVEMAALAVEKGYRTYNSGTAWTFFDYVATQYAFARYRRTSDHAAAVAALAEGALIVASMGKGYWTQNGHFICLYKCDGAYMYACDPASATRTKQKLSAFRQQVKKYFIFWPPAGYYDAAEPEASGDTAAESAPEYTGATGIYDVSKWQGKIDWEKVKASGKAGLMILRAGYGQETEDTRFQYNAAQCRALGIPFGVYWFSYATSVARAENEAESFYATASPFEPLFYCMDAEVGSITGDMIDAFTRRLRALGARKIVNYIANHRFKAYGADTTLPDAIWIPLYAATPPAHRPCDLWQTGGSKVPGISGSVDTNVIPESGRYPITWFLKEAE